LKQYLSTLFTQVFETLKQQGTIAADTPARFTIDRTKDARNGDFACNIAMVLSKAAKMRPRDLAEQVTALLPETAQIEKVEIAGPGFINIFLARSAYEDTLRQIMASTDQYGQSKMGAGQSVLVEYVSANPTGPLHVGHGRGAAYGSALANLLSTAGYSVHREYYVNDAGRQMDILATSVWLRYLELCKAEIKFPVNGYKGDYIWDIAAILHDEHGSALYDAHLDIYEGVPPDEDQGGDKEKHIDALITRCKWLLEDVSYRHVFKLSIDTILNDIRQDLGEFGVEYDEWFSEYSLTKNGTVQRAIEQLKAGGNTYLQDGALWFRSSDFGDEKDRVVIRDNGQQTYFASDIAYHLNKLERGFDQIINIWGADHHGYVPRVKAAMTALGTDADKLTVLLVQFANLYRGEERLPMSTRSGEFVTLRDLRKEVGDDAARFFYTQRKSEQHLDFDLELAKSQSNDNPVYYIQYAHARIASVVKQLAEQGITWTARDDIDLSILNSEQEMQLMTLLARYPEMVETAAQSYEPHQITYFLRELAQAFHTYYYASKFIVDDTAVRDARLYLIVATQQVLRNGLCILGVSAPEVM